MEMILLFNILAATLSNLPLPPAACSPEMLRQQRGQYVIEGTVQLDKECVYERTFKISSSDTKLDCRGATIDLKYRSSMGVLISPRPDVEIHNIVVKNCKIRNPNTAGIFVSNNSHGKDWNRSHSRTADEIRSYSPKNVVIDNIEVSGAKNAGIYIRKYVTGVTVTNSRVVEAYGACMYIDAYSQNNIVERNIFDRCGWRNRKTGMAHARFKARREGLAIDGASHNIVRHNTFSNNGGGGIFLYKNCSENNAKTGYRDEPASYNLIESNRFFNLPIGVWVASRQSRDLVNAKCADVSPYPGELAKHIFLDKAANNKIVGNVFKKITIAGIKVEDDFTEIRKNEFDHTPHDIVVGTKYRSILLRRPITGTIIEGNNTK